MSDQGSTGGDLWIVPAAGGAPRNLTPNRPATPAWIEWNGDRSLYVTELAGGSSRLVRFTLDKNRSRATQDATVFSLEGTIGDGRMEMSLSDTAGRSLFVFHASSFDRPTEIYAARAASAPVSADLSAPAATPNPVSAQDSAPAAGSPAVSAHFSGPFSATIPPSAAGFAGLIQLSHFNSGVERGWGRSLSLNWTNEGFHVQGWLLFPKDYDPARKYPLIVEVHGGPAAAVVSRWGAGGGLSPAAFSALGYFVLEPNPRGSFGQGEAFTQANRKDFGYGDLRDILAGLDLVEARFPVDPNRVGLTGWSYGGFMTMFGETQTQRFKAAVAGAGISDWRSYYGENSIGEWMIPYFGASVYDDPQVYEKSSAIAFIKNSLPPTLLVVGDRDGECPAPQSFEFWHALRDRHVPVQLVVYPNEGHGFVDPTHRRDVIERAVEWFARYMPPAS
jgi:dienelactone hydrolase